MNTPGHHIELNGAESISPGKENRHWDGHGRIGLANLPWGIRNSIQLGLFILTIGIGLQFFVYVLQATGGGQITVQRPPGVEGFLPIGALMG